MDVLEGAIVSVAALVVEEPAGPLGALALGSLRSRRRRSPRVTRSAGRTRGGAWHSVRVVVRAVRLLLPVFQGVAAHRVRVAVVALAVSAAV